MGSQRGDLRRRVVGDADFADLPFVAQGREGRGNVGRMGEQVGSMDLIEIDHVGVQTSQRRFTGAAQVRR